MQLLPRLCRRRLRKIRLCRALRSMEWWLPRQGQLPMRRGDSQVRVRLSRGVQAAVVLSKHVLQSVRGSIQGRVHQGPLPLSRWVARPRLRHPSLVKSATKIRISPHSPCPSLLLPGLPHPPSPTNAYPQNATHKMHRISRLFSLPCLCSPLGCSYPNGECRDSECQCTAEWQGAACNVSTCPAGCSGRGTCLAGRCKCDLAYKGTDCSILKNSEEVTFRSDLP